jgi:chromosome segregation ATPase
VGKEKDFLLAQKTSLHSQVETCSHQCTLFEQQNKEFAFKNEELQNKLKEKQAWMEQNEVKIKELMEKINNLSQLNAEQSKQIQELEQLRCVEQERYLTMMETFEMNKKHFLEEKKQLQKQLNDQKKQFEQIQKEKTKQLNEMIEAQLSANLLIEEQAHTIDDLLKSKKPTGTSTTGTCTTIGMTCSNKHDGYHHQYHQKIMELVKTLEKMTKEKENLEKKIEEQALTIHELTLDDDDDEEEEEEEEEEDGYANEDGQEENMEEEIQVKFLRRQKKKKDTIRTWTSPSKERRFKGSGISFKVS